MQSTEKSLALLAQRPDLLPCRDACCLIYRELSGHLEKSHWGADLIHFRRRSVGSMMVGQPGFFDLSDRYAALSAAGDPLEPLAAIVDFEVVRWRPVAALRRSARGKGGRPTSPPFDTAVIE